MTTPLVPTEPSLFSILFADTVPVATLLTLSTMTLVSSALGFGLLSRVVRHKLVPAPTDNFLGWRLPFRSIDDDGATIHCSEGTIARLYQVTGVDSFMRSVSARRALATERRESLNSLASYGVSITCFQTRDAVPTPHAPHFSNPVVDALFERYYRNYRNTYQNRSYLLVSLAVPARSSATVNSTLGEINSEILAKLAKYRPTLLHQSDPDPAARPLTVLSSLLNPIVKPHPSGPKDLQWQLHSDRWQFARNGGLVRFVNGQKVRYGAILSVRRFNGSLDDRMFQMLDKLPCELVIGQTFSPVGRDPLQIRTAIALKRGRSKIGHGITAQTNIDDSFDELEAQTTGAVSSNDRSCLWTYNLVITLFSDICTVVDPRNPERDPQAVSALQHLDDTTDQAMRILADHECTGVREGQASYGAWYSLWGRTMRGFQPREWWLTSEQAAHCLPLEGSPKGLSNCDWGDGPTLQLPTFTGGSYQFQFHVRERHEGSKATAHGMIIGPTEGGKTTTMATLLAATTRFKNHRIFCTDRQYGLDIFTKAIGGHYISFDGDTAPKLNPFDADKRLSTRDFLVPWLAAMTGTEATETAYAEIVRLVDDSFDLLTDRAGRTLRVIADPRNGLIPVDSDLGRRLAPWIDPKTSQGQVFNADRDTLDSAFGNNQWITFDFTDLYGNPALTEAVIPYISHKIAATLRSRNQSACIFLDEATSILTNQTMRAWFETMHREYRKRGIAVLSAFQDIPSLHRLGIMNLVDASLIQTIFFLPNPQASDEQYGPFKLTERELDFIRHANSGWGMKHALLLKRYAASNNESVVVNTDFSGVGEMLTIMASDDLTRSRVLSLQERHGSEWLTHLVPGVFGQAA